MKNKTNKKDNKKTLLGQGLAQKRSGPKAVRAKSGLGQERSLSKMGHSIEDPVVPLEQNLYGHPLAGLLWERKFEKVLLKDGWEKFPIGHVYSSTEKDCSYLCMWTKSNWLERNRTSIRPGKSF